VNLERIAPQVVEQNKEIELFNDDTALSVAQMIVCEALELVESIENAYLTDDLTLVAGEAGDCLYLLIRLFDLIGLDEKAVEMKLERNWEKYFGQLSRDEARAKWKEMGGDCKFFEDYLNKLAKD
jgi:phosphoribosyl-ATP pyrophosphohydrolase